ncbi:MAG: hypothetical protein LBF42_00980 [Puniceicoccales bacterium]|jgi:hypothetical protein|nr:hypothetical protein [Puniceicoccales bacterium]
MEGIATNSEPVGLSREDVISKAKSLLGSLIAASDLANSLARGAFNCIKKVKDIGVRHASRCLPQGVSLKISRAASVVGTAISNSRFGFAVLSFCSAHPAFVAGLAIITLATLAKKEVRDFTKTLLKLFLIDLPLVAFALAFTFAKIVAEVTSQVIKAVWRSESESFLTRKAKELVKTLLGLLFRKLPPFAYWLASTFVKILSWIINFMSNHKSLTAGFVMGVGFRFIA